MKKGIFLFALIASVLVLVSGCAKNESEGPIVLRFADNHPDGYPTVIGDLEFARLVEERSNGRIKIDVYNNAQLGDEKSVIEQVQFGGIDFTRVSISLLVAFSPVLDALQMPYLYRDADHLWKVLNGPVGEGMFASMRGRGFEGLVYFDSGARNFYNTSKPITSVEDMKGMKIRVQESVLMMDLISALGAVPTPMPYGEVYSSLKTGVIDGAENNLPSYDSAGHYEVAKYYTIDEHTRAPEIILASKAALDKLSLDDQALIRQAAKDCQAVQIQAWADYEKKSEEKILAAGNQVNKIENREEFVAAVQPLYEKQTPEIKALVEKIRAVK